MMMMMMIRRTHISWRATTTLPFHGKSVLDSKMMVEWIRPNLCPNLCPNLRQEGRHGEPKHSKQTRTKAFEIILSSLSTDTKATCLALSRQKRSLFEYDGKRHKDKPLFPNLRKEERQGELKQCKQSRTKAFDIISLPSRLIQRRPVLPFRGKSVLDSKTMVEGIRRNLVSKFEPRRKAGWNPNTCECFWNYLFSQPTDAKANCFDLSR